MTEFLKYGGEQKLLQYAKSGKSQDDDNGCRFIPPKSFNKIQRHYPESANLTDITEPVFI